MTPPRLGLVHQLTLRMVLVALGAIAITIVGYQLLYNLAFHEPVIWRTRDTIATGGFALLGALAAAAAAQHLSRQIVSPVRDIAASARQIAENNLTARASHPDQMPGEVRDLALDFNLMAARLERLAGRRRRAREFISHELRTPLMILQGQLQGALDGVYNPDERLLRTALAQVETLARTVGDLRVLDDIESGDYVFSHVSLDRLVNEACDAMEPQLQGLGFSIERKIGTLTVRVDQTRIRQAVTALLHNAAVHASPGQVTVTLQAVEQSAVIEVSSPGSTIGPELAETLFLPFKQGEDATTGSGLGLAIVRWIAEGHCGQAFHIPSSQGANTFRIVLPAKFDS